jgi:hypothetical protein
MRRTLEPMTKVAKSLRRHRHLIRNWFRAQGRISAGAVEGLNGIVKLITRKAFALILKERRDDELRGIPVDTIRATNLGAH